MKICACLAHLLLCIPLLGAAVHARGAHQQQFGQPLAQHKQLSRRAVAFAADVEKREAVKTAFLDNYANYEKYAAPSDKLNPVAMGGSNDSILAGFGGTIIDSLSTMLVMGLGESDAYQRALAHAKAIDFTQTAEGDDMPGEVSVFELTIRYIGGMLSAYQMNGEKPEEKFLVDQVVVLADRLSNAWYKGNSLPFNRFNLNLSSPVDTTDSVGIAEAGSLILEWGELAAYTANSTYLQLTEEAMDAIIASPVTFPGIFAQNLDAYNESTSGPPYYTWGGGSDSFWEYLLKWGQLQGLDRSSSFIATWDAAINSSIAHLVQKTGVGNLTLLSDYEPMDGSVYVSSHLASFAGGNWALGGALLNKPEYIQVGLEMAESYWRTYNETATGIGPESFGYFDAAGNAKGWNYVSPGRREFYNQHGFFLGSPGYIQRPETVESLFYGWRLTGQQMFRDMAWDAFLHMKEYLDTGRGWVGLVNVNDLSSGCYDETETLFAELFKYLYLIFDDPEHISLDDYVFTTEAHPFKIAARNPAFGKVQNFWPYEPLSSTAGNQGSPVDAVSGVPSVSDLTRLVTLTQGLNAAASQLAQQVKMPYSVARNIFSGLSRAPAVK